MRFHHTLQRLRMATAPGMQTIRGMRKGETVVFADDLRELLRHFDRLDAAARAAEQQKEPEQLSMSMFASSKDYEAAVAAQAAEKGPAPCEHRHTKSIHVDSRTGVMLFLCVDCGAERSSWGDWRPRSQ